MRPLVAVTGEGRPSLQEGWIGAPAAYLNAIWEAGGFPLMLAPDDSCALEAAGRLDALLLTGGWDVEPSLYGQKMHECTEGISVERDRAEIALIRAFAQAGKPVLGICRGIQVMAVAFGGGLYQHLPDVHGVVINHANKGIRHAVRLESHTRIRLIYGKDDIMVNSTHHQAVSTLPPGFRASAYSKDGVIEAIEYENMLGVQWHPERIFREGHICVFEDFISSARKFNEKFG